MAEYANKSRNLDTFFVDDKVWLSTKNLFIEEGVESENCIQNSEMHSGSRKRSMMYHSGKNYQSRLKHQRYMMYSAAACSIHSF